MQRIRIHPRSGWERIVESQGLHFHTLDGVPYWDESAYYRFTSRQIDEIEQATYALDEMCLQAAAFVIAERRLADLQIPPAFWDFVAESWERDELTIYGRFDLVYDGVHPPKMLEYNADTPTALLEAAVAQWFWLKDVHPRGDQFNSIHDRLIEAWTRYGSSDAARIDFASLAGNLEDYMTVNYLRDTAMQAGHDTQYIEVEQIGWDSATASFVDAEERPMRRIFKLYPWEWMLRESFGPHLLESSATWIEPPWKMVLSNKAILPILYELFPESPYLLEAAFEPLEGAYVRKPILAREGANVALMEAKRILLQTDGGYGPPYVYQRYQALPSFDGRYPVIGSWMVNGHACGIGIREDDSPITQNSSRFVPHMFDL